MSSQWFSRIVKKGNFLRFATERFTYDDELVSYNFKARGRIRAAAEEVGDVECGEFRAARSRGWKSHKHRYQWEHKIIEAEKRERKKERKRRR